MAIWKWSESYTVLSSSLQPLRLYSAWNSPGQNTTVGSLSLLQRIFPTQELNRESPALQVDSLPTELSGKPLAMAIYFLLIDVIIFTGQSYVCEAYSFSCLAIKKKKKSTLSNTLNHLKETLSSPVSGCRFKSTFWKCFSAQFSSVA